MVFYICYIFIGLFSFWFVLSPLWCRVISSIIMLRYHIILNIHVHVLIYVYLYLYGCPGSLVFILGRRRSVSFDRWNWMFLYLANHSFSNGSDWFIGLTSSIYHYFVLEYPPYYVIVMGLIILSQMVPIGLLVSLQVFIITLY